MSDQAFIFWILFVIVVFCIISWIAPYANQRRIIEMGQEANRMRLEIRDCQEKLDLLNQDNR